MIILLCPKCKSDNINHIKCCPIDLNGHIILNEYNVAIVINKLECNECGEIFEQNEASTVSK